MHDSFQTLSWKFGTRPVGKEHVLGASRFVATTPQLTKKPCETNAQNGIY